MICPCGKPMGHTGRHRTYPTAEQKAAARRAVKLDACRRWRERQRALGLCQCGEPSDKFARCLSCRMRDNTGRAERRRRAA